MIDFTSSLYLGMKHASAGLSDWSQLTTGVPSALFESIASQKIAGKIAGLQGLEKGILAPSTLHLYWDLFVLLSGKNIAVFIDENAYPVSRYGIERLVVAKIPIYSFNHLDANHLSELVKKNLLRRQVPVVITDGWCTLCGRPAPIKYYLEIINPLLGNIIIDDTQAFGILGEGGRESSYGTNGGGILRWFNINDQNIVNITSLSKAFGVPVASISGSATFIEAFTNSSQTRIYSSPVSVANINAAFNALSVNETSGDRLRNTLWSNVSFLRDEFNAMGINLTGSIFPVQGIGTWSSHRVIDIVEKLKAQGINTASIVGHVDRSVFLTIIIRSDTTIEEMRTLVNFIQKIF